MRAPASFALVALLVSPIWGRTAGAQSPAQASGGPRLIPCATRDVPVRVDCGTIIVPENRERPHGRQLYLELAILRARAADPAPDPVVVLVGGPGQNAVRAAGYLSRLLSGVLERRDVVLLEQRGTGGAHSLHCDLYGTPPTTDALFGELFPADAAARCREKHALTHDLSRYTTADFVADLEETRERLGYQQLNLFGISYGTRVVQVYLNRYPERVRAAVLAGVVAPDVSAVSGQAEHAARALRHVMARCEASPACRALSPSLAGDADRVFAQLQREAPAVVISAAGQPTPIRLTDEAAGSTIRAMLYSEPAAARVPALLAAAARGNLTPLAEATLRYRSGMTDAVAFGLYLAVTCSEDVPRIEQAERPRSGWSFMGSHRRDQLLRACARWPGTRAAPEIARPVSTAVPALFVSGALDPVTPPALAARAMRGFARARHVTFISGAHSLPSDAPCTQTLLATFIDSAAPDSLDASCADEPEWTPFSLEISPPR